MKREIEKKEEIAPQELPQEVVVKPKTNRKRLLIILGVGLVVLISLFGYLFFDKIIRIFDKSAVVENKETKEDTKEELVSDSDAKATIRIYKNQNDDAEIYVYEDKEFAEKLAEDEEDYYSKFVEIAKYNCKNADCSGDNLSAYQYNEVKDVLIKDGGYYLYNYETKSQRELFISDTDEYAEGAFYKGEMYGITFGRYNGTTIYYSLENDKEYTFDKVYDEFGNKYIVEKDGYFLFDYTKNSFTALSLEADEYERVSAVYYNDKLYGYNLGNEMDSENGSYNYYNYNYYSLKTNEIIIFDLETEIYGGVELLYNHIIVENKLYDLTTGEELHDFKTNFIPYEGEMQGEEDECYSTNAIGNKNGIYYFINTDCVEGYHGYVLDKNYNILFDGKEGSIENFGVDNDGHLIVNNIDDNNDSTTFSIYDATGQLISTSKTYEKVLGIFGKDEAYIAVVDTDDYLKLITSDGKVLAKFVKWTDDMHFHSMISGQFEYNNENGIYLAVQDNSIDSSEMDEGGYGYEFYYNIDTKKSGKTAMQIGGYGKPVLYLYPEKKTNITVTFENPKSLTTTYPKYKNSWQVTAYPNGDLYDKNNNYYYALYWEEIKNHEINFKEGFYVTKDNAIEFLESKLTTIGLNPKERNEFIMYWLPILEKNGKNLVYFELTEERDFYNKLIINPTPDSLLRVAIHVKKVSKKVDIKEQKLKTFERTGFAAIEWGGVEH